MTNYEEAVKLQKEGHLHCAAYSKDNILKNLKQLENFSKREEELGINYYLQDQFV